MFKLSISRMSSLRRTIRNKKKEPEWYSKGYNVYIKVFTSHNTKKTNVSSVKRAPYVCCIVSS